MQLLLSMAIDDAVRLHHGTQVWSAKKKTVLVCVGIFKRVRRAVGNVEDINVSLTIRVHCGEFKKHRLEDALYVNCMSS